MKRTATLLTLGLLMAGAASAQPNRVGQDVVWARDIGSATIAVDGTLDESVWAQAEAIPLVWDGDHPLPGGGQFFDVNPAGLTTPTDPTDATVYVLRKGNELYLGVEVADQSIGGTRNLFGFDGLMMTLINKSDRPETFTDRDDYFESSAVREEMMYAWFHPNGADTTATGGVTTGIGPRAWSTDFGLTFGDSSDAAPRSPEAWEYAATVDGVSNDDFNGGATFAADTGYTLEMRIRLDSLGWDLTQAMARMPLSIAINDMDFAWPQNPETFVRTRTWWQNRWLNNFNEGIAYIAGDPSVTVASGAAPAYTEPEFTVPLGYGASADPTIDGVLDEPLWNAMEPQFRLQFQADAEALDNGLPGVVAPYYTFYFHGDENTVVDPTVGQFRLFHRGNKLFIGLDTDDNAVNGIEGEGGRDGFRITISSLDSLKAGLGGALAGIQFDFSIDSTGAARLGNYAATLAAANPDAIQAGVSLKGTSTVADPQDVDSGYQMEVAIDLTALGYPDGLGDRQMWIALNYFDGDALQDDAQSYGTRTWIIGERNVGATLYGYLDPNTLIVTAEETDPNALELRTLGSYPNPTAGTATLRYELPRAGEVTVDLYDVLGRRVQTLQMGLQSVGLQSATIDATGLSAGSYVFRVRMDDGTSATGRMLVTR